MPVCFHLLWKIKPAPLKLIRVCILYFFIDEYHLSILSSHQINTSISKCISYKCLKLCYKLLLGRKGSGLHHKQKWQGQLKFTKAGTSNLLLRWNFLNSISKAMHISRTKTIKSDHEIHLKRPQILLFYSGTSFTIL